MRQLDRAFDPRFGGFGAAPKFPPSSALELLMRHHARTGDARSLALVTTTLDGMKNGGIYDHVGGGFARYSTDERWLVPHFEKMLYDNAQLARVYLAAHQLTKDPEYRRVARETLDYVLREMQSAAGGFYSATDADSEGEEGKFFVWDRDELDPILGEADARLFAACYDITEAGNWEGKNIANTPRPVAAVAADLGISIGELETRLATAKQKLYQARAKRVPPLLDDKILTAWNGLMIGAMAEGYRVLGDERYRESATRAARAVTSLLAKSDGSLYRTARGDAAHLDAYLEDYAYLGDALLDLYEAAGDPEHLARATALAERMLADFGDPDAGAFYFTANGHEPLIARTREGHDGALPSPNAVAARLLARLAVHHDRDDLRQRAIAALKAYGALVERSPRSFATSLCVADFLLEPPIELVLAGDHGGALARAIGERYLPNRVIAHVTDAASGPLTEGKLALDGAATLYVCRDYTCRAPITDPTRIAEALDEQSKEARADRRTRLGASVLRGHATPEGTSAFQDKLGEHWGSTGYTELGSTGLRVSRLGFGGYRVDDDRAEQRAALDKALREGVNLIDTSTNYTDGGSERMIGAALAELVAKGELWRDQIVVVSKLGYVQGKNLELAEERETARRPFPEMVKLSSGLRHCMHPEWLEDQLTRSLERLGLETLDVCLLHNPEYFLTDAARRGDEPLDATRDEFYQRLERAFRHLESEVERGRIRAYGVSSNSAVAPADDREATSLTRMLEAARRAGGEAHHFRVLQLPFNLLESGAALEKNHASSTVLEVARAERVAVLVNRPLNALVGDGLLRLADPPLIQGAQDPQAALERVGELEQEFRRDLAGSLRTGKGGPPPESLFNWAEQLGRLPAAAQTFAQWSEIEEQIVLPRTRQVMAALDRAMRGESEPTWRRWSSRYSDALEGLLAALRQRAADHSRRTSDAIHKAIDPGLGAERRRESLSRKALWVTLSTPGVTAVLVGMRRPAYVDDALAVLGWEPLASTQALLTSVSAGLQASPIS
ncbi:MAG: aldo/keto reductase [Polyangiaceae bacterium]